MTPNAFRQNIVLDTSVHSETTRTGRSAKTDRIGIFALFAAFRNGKKEHFTYANVYTLMYSELDVGNCVGIIAIDHFVITQVRATYYMCDV